MTFFIDELIVEPLSRYIEPKYTKADAPRLLKKRRYVEFLQELKSLDLTLDDYLDYERSKTKSDSLV